MMCCGINLKFKDRYKILVDNIFPKNPGDGLVRNEMEKLTYYALSSPEKLHRIGEYFSLNLNKFISRNRKESVIISMEGMNQLLKACHAQQINLFIESFLNMVYRLLETNDAKFQVLGSKSFVKFSKIEEDSPSYHRKYDFFVSKFSAMCHAHNTKEENTKQVRLHGLFGLQGIIRKTAPDTFQVKVWDSLQMKKIMHSLLENMYDLKKGNISESEINTPAEKDPPVVAEEALRDLLNKVTFATLPLVIDPVLEYMDTHKMWCSKNNFAVKTFSVLMSNMNTQVNHIVIKSLLSHLLNYKDNEEILCCILDVLCKVLPKQSSASLGPSVIDVFNRLSKELGDISETPNKKSKYCNCLINTSGVFGKILPVYQKLEAVAFYLNKIKDQFDNIEDNSENEYVTWMLQSVIRITETYTSYNMNSITCSITDPLFELSLVLSPLNRALALRIIIKLFDKRDNIKKVKLVNTFYEIEQLGLEINDEEFSDREFFKSNSNVIANFLAESFLLVDNNKILFKHLCECVVIMCLSHYTPEIVIDLCCRVLLFVQSTVLNMFNTKYNNDYQFLLQVISSTGCCMLYIAFFSSNPKLKAYIQNLIENRLNHHACLTASNSSEYQQKDCKNITVQSLKENNLLLNIEDLANSLGGHSVRDKLCVPIRFNQQTDIKSSKGSISIAETDSLVVRVENSSELSAPRRHNSEDTVAARSITCQYLKKVLYNKQKKQANKKSSEHFRTAPFEQLMAEFTEKSLPENKDYLRNLLSNLQNDEVASSSEKGLNIWQISSLLYC